MRILIVGAGIAGLAAAIFLEKKGIEVKLIERTASASHLGFIVFLYPNSTFLLKDLGIYDQVRAKSTPMPLYRILDYRKRSLFDVDFKKIDKEIGGESLLMERNTLHSSLLERFGEKKVAWKTELVDLNETEKNVQVTYRNGEKEKFDFVVGADGINSIIRNHYFAMDDVLSYHMHVWIYWLNSKFKRPKHLQQLIGKNSSFFFFPLSEKKTAVYVASAANHQPEFIDRDIFNREFVDYKKPIPEIVESAATAKLIYKATLRHIETEEWYRGRVILIGDANHAMSPLTGLGSTVAMQDAYVLAEELAKEVPDYRIALELFKKRRMRVMRKIKKFSKETTEMAINFSRHGMHKYLFIIMPFMRPFLRRMITKSLINSLKEPI